MQKKEASGFKTADADHSLVEQIFSITPGSTTLSSALEQTFTLVGALAADRVIAVNVTTQAQTTGGGSCPGRVTSAGQIAILFFNCTTSNYVPAAGLYSVMLSRRP